MSRSNPTTEHQHPCTRWLEWSGSEGELRYYDKAKKKNVAMGDDFTFILLDQLATIKGWHDASDSGIHSNEVRDTKQDVFVVKSFKGGVIAEGLYQSIRDRVNAMGGHFTTNCYIAFKNGELAIGSVQFKGAALNAWVEFTKENRSELYKKAIRIKGFAEGKKGKIVFRTPKFQLADITDETNNNAVELDAELQKYFESYLARPKTAQVERPTQPSETTDEPASQDDTDYSDSSTDVPF